jgi:hypothetical protein
MAGSGPFASINQGWISGSGYRDRNRERRNKFLADHPEWEIVYVRSLDRHEASTGDHDTELVVMSDPHLGALMDRLEARYPVQEEGSQDQAR